MWDENTYPFANLSGTAIAVLEWISNFILYFLMDVIIFPCQEQSKEWIGNFISYFVMDVITFPCQDQSKSILVKGAQGISNGIYISSGITIALC